MKNKKDSHGTKSGWGALLCSQSPALVSRQLASQGDGRTYVTRDPWTLAGNPDNTGGPALDRDHGWEMVEDMSRGVMGGWRWAETWPRI